MRQTPALPPTPKPVKVAATLPPPAPVEEVVKEDLRLWDSQEECNTLSMNAFKAHPTILNTSVMGAGKTYLSLNVALELGLDVLVICPASLQRMWRRKAVTIKGINLVDVISYEKLIGYKHECLTRGESGYTVTSHLSSLLHQGTLVIMDEVAAIKNNKAKCHAAAHAVSSEVSRQFAVGGRSRCYLMSATPFDKVPFSVSFLQLFGLTSHTKMHHFDQSDKEYELLGMQDVISQCASLDPAETKSITKGSYSEKVTSTWCWELYKRVLKPRLVFSASKPNIEAKFLAYNGFYDMPEHEVGELRDAVSALQRVVRYNRETHEAKGGSLQLIQKALMRIAKAKVPLLGRVAYDKLSSDPNAKVILFVEYKDSIAQLCDRLAVFSPRVLNGPTKVDDREAYVDKFQEDNTESRLLIVHPVVGGAGLSLDDTTGNHPRFSWYIPTYRFIDLVQSSGRTHRGTTQSDATVFGLYCKQFPHEKSMLDSILRKTNVCKEVVANAEDIKFPGEYETYVEGFDRIYPVGANVNRIMAGTWRPATEEVSE